MRKALVALVVLGAVAFVFPAHARAAVGAVRHPVFLQPFAGR